MFTTWCLLCGALLITVGLSDTWRQSLPFSTSAIYLVAGYLVGPEVFALLDLSLDSDAKLLEHLAEAAVLISLFAVGLRLRARLRDRLWRVPLVLATVAMLVTIGLMWTLGLALGLAAGTALLLAAVLAPTDPVLASDVQVSHAQDSDRVRFSLTAEGGLNDGAAFPFVMLALAMMGLHDAGPWGLRWFGVDVLWATAAGLVSGWVLGTVFSRAVVFLRREKEQAFGMESFFTLGLIALSYGLATAMHAYGFLAVFAAGLAMRQLERLDNPAPRSRASEAAIDATTDPTTTASMTKAVLDFTLDLERLVELAVMLVIGSLLTRAAFSVETVAVALALMFVARPLAVYLTTFRSGLTGRQRQLVAWFGIRGIGSMYYLAYASAHGARTPDTVFVADAVLVTIALSVLLHGSSATPVMRLYGRARSWRRRP
jgi:NhaP-type Na+/H+ or K+/H+ antiporter